MVEPPWIFQQKTALTGRRPVSIGPHALFTSMGKAEEAGH